jgi:hypothetical protein
MLTAQGISGQCQDFIEEVTKSVLESGCDDFWHRRARWRWSKLREWLIGSDRPSAAVLMRDGRGEEGPRPTIIT